LHRTENMGYTYHDGMMFTTNDHNNDPHSDNCALIHGGGWWYNKCYYVNLASPEIYHEWVPFSAPNRKLTASRMMIKQQ